MNRTEIEAQASIMAYKSELEWLENHRLTLHRLTLHGLLIDTSLRIELLKKLIREEQGKK